MSMELLPCPFCGRGGILSNYPRTGDKTYYEVSCISPDCWADTSATMYPTRDKAIAAWNTRTPNPSALAALEAACDKARWLAVATLAFHGRDRGTDRQERMLDDLEALAIEVDDLTRSALSAFREGER